MERIIDREHNIFFLGGYDLEMVTIRDLLEKNIPGRFHDKGLFWNNAKASEYKEEIEECFANKSMPVLIELKDDIGLNPLDIVFIHHHGERAGANKPTSLHQIFRILDLPQEKWSRWFDLVAANDRGYIPELIKTGATIEEIIEIRAADRKAQGITEEQELQGVLAISQVESFADARLKVVHLPHSHTAVVTDRFHPALGGIGYHNLLVISPNEVNFYGEGHLVIALGKKFPDGWFGGALPEQGFWGHSEPVPDVLTFLIANLITRKKEKISS